MQTFLEIIVEV